MSIYFVLGYDRERRRRVAREIRYLNVGAQRAWRTQLMLLPRSIVRHYRGFRFCDSASSSDDVRSRYRTARRARTWTIRGLAGINNRHGYWFGRTTTRFPLIRPRFYCVYGARRTIWRTNTAISTAETVTLRYVTFYGGETS